MMRNNVARGGIIISIYMWVLFISTSFYLLITCYNFRFSSSVYDLDVVISMNRNIPAFLSLVFLCRTFT